jgi:membrane protease YdiL (CAAX protease family)
MNDTAQPPPLPASNPPPASPPYGRLGAALAMCVIACMVLVVLMQSHPKGDSATEEHPNRTLELMARYAIGVKELMGKNPLGEIQAAFDEALVQNVTQVSRGHADGLRVLIVKGWLTGAWPAASELDAIAAQNEGLKADVETLNQLKANNGEVKEEDWKKFQVRHGWIADLARAQAKPAKDPARAAVVQQGMATAVVLIGVSMMGMLVAAGGLAVMILAIVRWRSGKLNFTLALRSAGQGGVLLEGFAVYLALFLFLPRLLPLPHWAVYAPALAALLLGMTWPLLRGMRLSEWREALGLHRGQGWLREIGVGMLGWVASLPLLVAGMIAASWIMKLTGEFPTHPIVEVFAGSGWAKFGAVLLAVVWAPVSEEIMFRGLLFPGLSAWLRWLMGLLLSAFVFAAIHPQGWAGVPAIMALACSFSLLRMWRQSLIAPMTAHALNNGIMCLVMLFLWR